MTVAFAQQLPVEQNVHIKYQAGQDVVPIYAGWERVPDGSFNMVFGYLNRNHVQELNIAVGAQNGFEPGPADRGQPTYFYPRENPFLFRVNVPKDWDKKKELVWTVVANGKTNQARATLMDIWEIDRQLEVANAGGGTAVSPDLILRDQPPSITVAAPARATVGTAAEITASVTDDGIPGERKPRPQRQTEPSLRATRAAVAGQRAAADETASAAESVGDLDGLARTRGRDIRSGRLRQSRRWKSGGEGHLQQAGHVCPARLRARRPPAHAR